MKRAQIEAARIRAKELKEEEKRKKLEWVPPAKNDFTVHAHLLRKKLKTMAEPLGETARHANFIVTQEKLVIIPKLKHKLVVQEIKNATITHTGIDIKMTYKHFKTWLFHCRCMLSIKAYKYICIQSRIPRRRQPPINQMHRTEQIK